MIPYASFLYFGVLAYVVVPAVLLAFVGGGSRLWILLATAGMLVVQYGGILQIEPGLAVRELWIVASFALFEWAVAAGFLRLRARGDRRCIFYGALLLAVLPMAAGKYVPAFVPQFQFGFLGISYVTLRALDIIICTQDRLIAALPLGQFFTYLFFFATISSGPIDRYRRFTGDWARQRTRAELLEDLDGATHRLFRGFLYKFILAALIDQYWLRPAAGRADLLGTLSYMYAYSFYLFFDFAGYTAFAVAVSYVFGIRTPENFNRPFLAHNIRDFWNRWNITLSWWLRDHIYMRFVMAAMKGQWFASKYVASYLGLILAFGLMGVWHGAALHFVLYGLYHGVLLASHEAFARWNRRRNLWGDGPVWHAAAVVGNFHCVCFGFLLFSGHLTMADGSGRRAADGVPPAYDGRYEKADCDEVGGWAWDAAHPAAPLDVEIVADGRVIGRVRADLQRRDLAEAGKGSGAHGFIFVLPDRLRDGWPHEIGVRVAGTGVELEGGPRSIACGARVRNMDGREGAHEVADCAVVSGWARDATQPGVPISVDVYDGATLMGTVVADREWRGSGGPGAGRHGFSYRMPVALRDGAPHSVAVRIGGTNIPLAGTPRIVTCSETYAPAPNVPDAEPAAVTATATAVGEARPVSPAYVDNRDGTITAAHTGLVWEKKIAMDGVIDRGNPHDADNCYPWAGTCAAGGVECRVDADCGGQGPCRADDCQANAPEGRTIFQWLAALNAAHFAGHDDWRLPTSQELYGLVNPLEEGDPATNAAFVGASCGGTCVDAGDPACSCTQPGLYWAGADAPAPDDAWMGLFYCNGHLFLDVKANTFFVRAVRGGTPERGATVPPVTSGRP